MKKTTPRQSVTLREWKAQNPKQTAPHYSGRITFDSPILTYLSQCAEVGEAPELFISLWVNGDDGTASLGVAVPIEWVSPANRLKREEFSEWVR